MKSIRQCFVGLTIIGVVMLLKTLHFLSDIVGGGGSSGGDHAAIDSVADCGAIFTLSSSLRPWEKPEHAPNTCKASIVASHHIRRCIERLFSNRHRPASLLFVGDSRARIIFEQTVIHFNLTWSGRSVQDTFPDVPNAARYIRGPADQRCSGGYKMYRNGKMTKLVCDLHATSDVINATFRWSPYVDENYLSILAEVDVICRASAGGGGGGCADIVVLTTGMWTAKPPYHPVTYKQERVPLQDRALYFREQIWRLPAVLQSLSNVTQVVYRPDGPEYTESKQYKSTVGGAILTSNVLAMTVLQQVPAVHQWTSSLTDSLRFYHGVCLPLAWRGLLEKHRIRYECLDENHVGATVRAALLATLSRMLCREEVAGKQGDCCTITQRTN